MSLIHLEKESYDEVIAKGIVLVDFYASWCGPCKMLAPVLEALAKEKEDINIVKIDVDEQEEIARRFSIMTVPTLYLYKDGKLIADTKGFYTMDMLKKWIESAK